MSQVLTRQTIAFESEAEWLAARKVDLTSTEAAALFDCSPYATEFELHQYKTGRLQPEFTENDRMKWGKRLESVIAEGIGEDYGLKVVPFKTYLRIPELRMGSSFDFKVVGLVPGAERNKFRDAFDEHGPGILEIKNVDGLQFRRAWIDDGYEEIEAPPHIELQVCHQLEVADMGWAMIAPLVGGNTPKALLRKRDVEFGEQIRERVAKFWKRIEEGKTPDPHYVDDAETIGRMYIENDGSSINLTGNQRVFELCRAYKAAGDAAKKAELDKKAAKAELLTIIGAAKAVQAAGFKISAGTLAEQYRAVDREAGERVTIRIDKFDATSYTATYPKRRDVRINTPKA
jgi:predicted phage-related endonuclease